METNKINTRECLERKLNGVLNRRLFKGKFEVRLSTVGDYTPHAHDDIKPELVLFNNSEEVDIEVYDKETNEIIWSKKVILSKETYIDNRYICEGDIIPMSDIPNVICIVINRVYEYIATAYDDVDRRSGHDLIIQLLDTLFRTSAGLYTDYMLMDTITECDKSYLLALTIGDKIRKDVTYMANIKDCPVTLKTTSLYGPGVLLAEYKIQPTDMVVSLKSYTKYIKIPMNIDDTTGMVYILRATRKIYSNMRSAYDRSISGELVADDLNTRIGQMLSFEDSILLDN